MQLLTKPITRDQLKTTAKKSFGNMVKAVVDIEKKIMVIDAQMHADQEQLLLQHGSNQQDLWGINLYPDLEGEDFVEFDSMINLRPSQNNMSRSIEDPEIQTYIRTLVDQFIRD